LSTNTVDTPNYKFVMNSLPELIQEKMDLVHHTNDIKSKLDELVEDYKRSKKKFGSLYIV